MDFSVNPQNIKVFHPQYHLILLKVTKFLSKISKFEFLVITKKNIFAYKLFLSLNISNFNWLCNNCNPLKKVTPSFPATPHWDWQTETWVIYLQHTQNSRIQELPCISLVTWIIHWSLTDRLAGRRDRQTKRQACWW